MSGVCVWLVTSFDSHSGGGADMLNTNAPGSWSRRRFGCELVVDGVAVQGVVV